MGASILVHVLRLSHAPRSRSYSATGKDTVSRSIPMLGCPLSGQASLLLDRKG
jgi:hypothetical protein